MHEIDFLRSLRDKLINLFTDYDSLGSFSEGSMTELRQALVGDRKTTPEGMCKNLPYVPKGWGYEIWLCNTERYCGKQLFLRKDKKNSWHYHKVKEEHFYVQSGEVSLVYGWSDNLADATEQILRPGDVFFVPTGLKHRFFGNLDSTVIEFSTTHSDSDSIRLIPGD